MTQAILNPVKLKSLLPLLPAEREFAGCLREGKLCAVGNGELPRVPIIHGDSANFANVVRPEVLRFFAYGGDPDKHPVRRASIDLLGAWICGEQSLDLTHAHIPYALGFFACHFAGAVAMQHVECAALNLSGSHLAKGLNADGLKTKGDVNLRAVFSAESEVRFSAEGEVRLLGASIGGNLDCEGGKFHNPEGYALNADGLTTKGNVSLRTWEEKGKDPILFSAKGGVRLLGASIGGNLDCKGGKFFSNPKRNALYADGMAVKGSVFFKADEGDEKSIPFSADGEVRLLGASIGGNLDCKGGKFHNPKGYALAAESAKIGGSLIWRKISGNGVIHLGYAAASVLADELDSWKPFKVILDGFTYGQIVGPTNATPRINWLGGRPENHEFSPLPYEQAAKVLFGMGHASDARKTLLEKEREVTKRKKWWQRPLRWLWDEFAGYGYRLWRTVAWSLAAVVVGWGVFSHASDIGGIVPHQPAILASDEYQQARQGGFAEMESVREKFSEYPEFNPLVFSADVFIPLFALHQEPFWYPVAGSENILALLAASQHGLALAVGGALLALWMFMALEVELRSWPRLAMRWKRLPRQSCSLVLRAVVVLSFYLLGLESPRHWYWLEIGAGWILTSLFLLSVTGFLRPRQSSGEKG